MATYLPIRAFNRSQKVRIGNQTVNTTTNTYIDVDDAAVRKQLGYHSAIGAVYVTGPLTDTNSAGVVAEGGIVTLGSITGEGTTSFVTATVSALTLLNRDTAVNVNKAQQTQAIVLLADLTSGKSANVIVYVDNTTGAVGYIAGAAANTGSQVDGTVPSGKTVLARLTFTYATTNATGTVTDIRPLA